MYTHYTTRAVILTMQERGEDDRVFSCLTEDFGKIIAYAKGVRKITSKLRGHLVVGTVVRLTLIRGKHVWRITDSKTDIESRKASMLPYVHHILHIAHTLTEYDHLARELFISIAHFLAYITHAGSSEAERGAELLVLAKMLHTHGILPRIEQYEDVILSEHQYSDEMCIRVEQARSEFLSAINKALAQTA